LEENEQERALRHRLTGLTIHPAVATSIVTRAGVLMAAKGQHLREAAACPGDVRFDGTGRIVAIKPGALSPALAARLEAAVIKPLTATRSEVLAQAPRPARSVLTVAMHTLRSDESPEGKALMDRARKLFLSGSVSRESVAALIDDGARRLGKNELLRAKFEELAVEIKKPATTPQLADNLYGRTFESLLAEDLVRDPPEGILNAAQELGKGVLDTLASLNPEQKASIIEGIAKQVRGDWRIWYGQSPTIKEFARNPSMETLKACLEHASNGIEAIKIPMIATHMFRSMKTRFPDAMPSWLRKADAFYNASVYPQKPQDKSILSDGARGGIEARRPGNLLHYQPSATTFEMQGTGGKNHSHARVVAPDAAEPGAPASFMKDALTRGQTVVTGPSGQTSLLTFFGQHLADVNPRFPVGDHHLNTLAMLVFDGGHSTEEVLHTLSTIEKATQSWVASLAALYPCSPDPTLRGYEAIARLGDTDADQQALRQRLEKALDKTLDFHASHVALA